MIQPSTSMQSVLDQLMIEDADLADPTLLLPSAGRALAELTNMRWNAELPEVAKASTLMLGDIPARYIVPQNDTGSDAILHIHGGGWAFCSAATHEGAARRLANSCGAPVLTIEYRHAPEHPFPAAIEDILDVWYMLDSARRWSIAGDSAGANLAVAAMLQMSEEQCELPANAMLFYGVFDSNFNTQSYIDFADGPGLTRAKMQRYWDWYAHKNIRKNPKLAPLFASDTQLLKLPEIYFNAAGLDPLRSDTENFAARLKSLGRKDHYDLFEGVVHGFMQMGSALPEARNAFEKAGSFFKERAAHSVQPT